MDSTSKLIDAKIQELGDWRGKTLSRLRALIKTADALAVEEVKWRKPTNPTGVPVWSHDGIVCIGEALKSVVRLTFPKGALIKDPKSSSTRGWTANQFALSTSTRDRLSIRLR